MNNGVLRRSLMSGPTRSFRRVPTPLVSLLLSSRRYVGSNTPSSIQNSEDKAPSGDASLSASPQSLPYSASLLDDLLHPAETIDLVDSTRTYKTMDIVPPLRRFDPNAALYTAASNTVPKPPTTTTTSFTVAAEMDDTEQSTNSKAAAGLEEDEEVERDEMRAVGPVKLAHKSGRLWELYTGPSRLPEQMPTPSNLSPDEKQKSDSVDERCEASEPPHWFYQLCWDLYHRTDSSVTATTKDQSTGSEANPSMSSEQMGVTASPSLGEEGEEEFDPYLFLPFEMLDESEYEVGPYSFPLTATYSTETRVKLCLGRLQREFVCFGLAYPFPERYQLPTSVGTRPSRLLVDPTQPVPVIYLQLDEMHPPALWLPLKPTAAAVRRALSNFAVQASLHRNHHHERWAKRFEEARRVLELQRMLPSQQSSAVCSPATGFPDGHQRANGDEAQKEEEEEAAILRMVGYHARHVLYSEASDICQEYPNEQNFFLGEFDDPETEILSHVDLCPWLFAIPEMRCVVDLHAEHCIPTIEGPGVAISLYRCRHSKALLQIMVQLSAEVKLPPLDMESFEFMWKDAQVVPKMKIPVFARIIWPSHTHLAGGGGIVRRWNAMFQTEFAEDMPVDAVMALFETMQWARPHVAPRERHMGVLAMREHIRSLLVASHYLPLEALGSPAVSQQYVLRDTENRESKKDHNNPQSVALVGAPPPLLYPGTAEIPNPEYTIEERLGMHLQYWSHLDEPTEISQAIRSLLPLVSAPVRMGCAKAALIAGDRQLFREIVSREPPGRMQVYMTKMVKKRKTRDLTDAVPRLLEDQYEFASPLWTARHTRIDPNTVEGQIDLRRLRAGGR